MSALQDLLPPHVLDTDRLGALESYAVLGTPPEEGFDDIAQLASQLCAAPTALVSLISDDRLWFKARVGFPLQESDLDSSVCVHVLSEPDLLVIPDLSKDHRTRENPFVAKPSGIRFYAGAPLRTPDGKTIGSLCVIDEQPRLAGLTDAQANGLRALARQVMTQLELRRAVASRDTLLLEQRSASRERKALQAAQAALVAFNDRTRDLDDPDEIAFVACEVLGAALGITRVGYGTIDKLAETIVIDRDWTARGIASLAGILHFRDYGSYIDELKRGVTVVVHDVNQDPRTRANAAALKAIEAQAFVNMPLVEQGQFVALLYATHTVPHVWNEGDVALIREVAERTRITVERVRSEAAGRRQAAELARLNAILEEEVEKRTRERDRVWSSTNDLMGTAGLDGYLKTVNPAWTRMLGWSEAELLAKPFGALIDPEDHAETADVVRRLAAGETVTDFVDRVAEKDGGQRVIMWDATPDGEHFHIVGRDITALRHTEAALRQSQKMEAVGQLTGGIAHDFNNLLTGITGSLDLMATRIEQGRYKDIDRYAAAARGAAKRAAALTHRLLAFSRQQTLEPKPVDMNRLVAGMEDLVRRTAGPSITVEVVAAGGLWATLVDPHQLENALLNLCINARDAMPDGGRLTVETGNRWLDARAAKERELPQGQYVSLCVSDTGTGMPPDVIARAFDPFFTTKPLGQGTGLGLSMIYGFARQSGGQVRIYSEVGHGTNVCIYLPRRLGASEIVEPQAEVPDVPMATAGETVLVVDDEPTIRMLVTDVLEDLGYAAIEAADAPSGLKVLRSDVRIDLLVTDVGLPGNMNGRQMADAARVGRPKLKVLFITGYAENAAVGNGLLDPGMHVMTKPFAMDALASRIRELIVGA